MIAEAVTLADPVVDFSQTDLIVVLSDPDAAEVPYGPTWLGYLGPGGPIDADGNPMTNGITSGADLLFWQPPLWLAHEMGHSFGLPDFYSYETSGPSYTGHFDLMNDIAGQAPEPFAFVRWQLGWLDDEQVLCHDEPGVVTVDLTPVEEAIGLQTVMVPLDDTRAVVVESRRPLGYDDDLQDPGVVVMVVDTSVESGAGPVVVANDQLALDPGQSITVEGVTVTYVERLDDTDTVRVER